MTQLTVDEKLARLRKLMKKWEIDYYYVPASDEHHNEYLPACWQRRSWISEFTGSAGDVLIGEDSAYLWTDARYFLQAHTQLNPKYFELVEQTQGMEAPIANWLKKNAQGKRVGVDPKLISIAQANEWQHVLSTSKGELVSIEKNLVDEIWEDQPPLKTHPIKRLDEKYAGLSTKEKLARLRSEITSKGADAQIITMLDAIAWLFNVRGKDIEFNPLIISYAIITKEDAVLFLDLKQVSDEDLDYFQSQHTDLKSYSSFDESLKRLKGKILLDANNASWWISQHLSNASIVLGKSPITLMKAIKNPQEVTGMQEAHRRDGIAMCRFLHWLENNWQGKTESSAADQLEVFRRDDEYCQGLSFQTISGYGDHGAIIHYSVSEETDRKINDDNLYLIDSGGQYLQGTTDITRTIHLGDPTPTQKHHYTLILKGHLAIRHMLFPDGINGEHINAIAHLPLWNEALDFNHGTGHGVGAYLCVHEGPQRISWALTDVPLKPNMIVSNEPGLYLEGQYGIRIENLCVIVKKVEKGDSLSGDGPFYGFEDLTVVPYARNLINKEELTTQEIDWINEYHQYIYQLLSKDLSDDVRAWLKKATLPL